MNKYLNIVLFALILIVISLGAWLYVQKSTPQTIYITRTKVDTIYKFDTTNIIIVKPTLKTIYKERIDTIIIDRAFEKTIDTTLENAKLQVTYIFPQDTFKIKLQTKIAEILRTDTLYKEIQMPPIKNNDKWIYGGIGVGIGIILGVIIAK